MPKFILPELKSEGGNVPMVEDSEYDPLTEDAWYRKVRIPASKEIIDALNVGDTATVKLRGIIKTLESTEKAEGKERQEFELSISSVEAYSENEYSELLDEDDD